MVSSQGFIIIIPKSGSRANVNVHKVHDIVFYLPLLNIQGINKEVGSTRVGFDWQI